MITRFHQLALEANERQANVRDDVLRVPTLDERVSLYLRAVHGNREFTEEERSNARNALLDSMAAEITAQVQPEVTEPRPLHPYEAPTQYWQSVQRKVANRNRDQERVTLRKLIGVLPTQTNKILGSASV